MDVGLEPADAAGTETPERPALLSNAAVRISGPADASVGPVQRNRGRPMIDRSGVAVITGAANGIGAALAQQLASRGARVALVDVDGEGLERVGRSLSGATRHVCDVSNEDAVAKLHAEVLEAHHAASIVINNAGLSVAGPIESVPLAEFRRAMDVNFWATVLVSRAFVPELRKTASRGQHAALCNVLSDFALFSLPTKAPYAASKHATKAFTESLAAELSGSGVTVTAVYPGATATGIIARGYAIDDAKRRTEAAFLARGLPPDAVARAIVRGIDRRHSRVLVGRDTRAIDLATRIAPGLVQDGVRRFWRRVPFL